MKKFLAIVALVMMASCGAAAEKTVKRSDGTDVIGSGNGNGEICGAAGQTVVQNPSLVSVSSMAGQSYRLCDILKSDAQATATKTNVYQFTNSQCIGCREEGKEIGKYIAQNNLGNSIRHYVIFVDNKPATAALVAEFMADVRTEAPNAIQLDDKDGAAAKVIFGTRETIFPLAMVLNNQGDRDVKFYGEGSETVVQMLDRLVKKSK